MRERWREACLLLLVLKTFGFQEGDPEKPQGLVCYQMGPSGGMNCTRPSRTGSGANTTYTLHCQSLKFRRNLQDFQFPAGQSWVVIQRSNLKHGESYTVWLEDGNETQITPKLNLTLQDIVKPDPPELVQIDTTTVRWTNPSWPQHFSWPLSCNLRYRMSGVPSWTRVLEEDLEPSIYEFSNLEPFTAYEVQARCIPQKGFWSDWSPSVAFQTPEAAPVGLLDVWQATRDPEYGEPSLLLLWKPLSPKAARGVIQSYRIIFRTGSDGSDFHLDSPCCYASLPSSATHIWISAHSRAGQSQPTSLFRERQDLPIPVGIRAVAKQQKVIRVTWEPSKDPWEREALGYLVEWIDELNGLNTTAVSWVRVPAHARSALLTGDFRPWVPYQVRVYGLYHEGFGASAPVRVYTQEGVPSAGPQGLQDRSISKIAYIISWEAIPLAQRNGHITHYTLYLDMPTKRQQTYGPIAATETSYILLDLKPETSFQVWMTGSTSAGEGNSSSIHLFYVPDPYWEAVLASLLTVGFLLVLACIVGGILHAKLLTLCQKVLPRCCWEKVPDPGHSRITLDEVDRDPHNYMGPLVQSQAAEALPITQFDIGEPVPREKQGYSTLSQLESPPPALPHGKGADDGAWSQHRTEELGPGSPTLEEECGELTPVISGYEKHFMPTPEEVLGLA